MTEGDTCRRSGELQPVCRSGLVMVLIMKIIDILYPHVQTCQSQILAFVSLIDRFGAVTTHRPKFTRQNIS